MTGVYFSSPTPQFLVGVMYHSPNNDKIISHMSIEFVLDNMIIISVSSKLMGLH